MSSKQKSIFVKFARITILGLIFGIAVGYVADKANWGFSYQVAIPMVLGCAYGVQVFDSLSTAFLFPRFEKYSRGKKLSLQMVTSLLVDIFGWLFFVSIAGLIMHFNILHWEVIVWLPIFVVLVFIVTSISRIVSFYRELRQKDIVEQKLKALAAQAELKALKAQINPHFLFNSLNTIASLTSTSPSKAEEAVEKLADVFRYTLSSSNKEFVTLQNELDFLDSYLGVEKARFGDRLKVIKSIQPEILDTHIPSLILQPLVENSIKYGNTRDGEAKIEIRGFMDDAIHIEVRDQGIGVPEEIKKGIYTKGTGLRNVNERLLKIYGDRYGLKFKDNIPNGTIAMITIPRGYA